MSLSLEVCLGVNNDHCVLIALWFLIYKKCGTFVSF